MKLLQKTSTMRLGVSEYSENREQVLRRDRWRCQFCGSMTQLEVHHQLFRSHSGSIVWTTSSQFVTVVIRLYTTRELGCGFRNCLEWYAYQDFHGHRLIVERAGRNTHLLSA